MAQLELTFVDKKSLGGFCLKAKGKVVSAWGKWKHGYGFFGLAHADFRGDRRVQLGVQIVARPNHLSHHAADFPRDLEAKGEIEIGVFALKNGKITIVSWIEAITDSLGSADGPRFRSVPVTLGSRSPIRFDLDVSLRIEPPPGRRPGTIREWNTQFASGGLPSLGKHRP